MTDAPDLEKCNACNRRRYHRCDCWPGDYTCGFDYEACKERGGEGWIDHPYDYLNECEQADIFDRAIVGGEK